MAALMAGSIVGSDEMGKGIMGKQERRASTIAAIGPEGQKLVPRHIEIENVEKADGSESWVAMTAIGNYRCTVITGRSDATCSKMN
ncbi:hypothetical protein ACLBKT_09210 [Erythrobacter sp. W302b]|uniref:hypothetical protein n=1 Tax=Erythrobacter sp. W302b TaxID=3389874 RepID=UPI00396B358C